MNTLQKLIKTTGNGILALVSGHVKNKKAVAHKHKWKATRIDAYGGQRYVCETCQSEGVKHSHHNFDMKVLTWSDKAKQLPHEHEWCFEYNGGRKAGADKSTLMSKVCSCECGKWAVKHYGETEYQLLADVR